jgi:hypothetical protein
MKGVIVFWEVTSSTEICALLGYNVVSSGNPLPTVRDHVSVPTSRVKKSKKIGLLDP